MHELKLLWATSSTQFVSFSLEFNLHGINVKFPWVFLQSPSLLCRLFPLSYNLPGSTPLLWATYSHPFRFPFELQPSRQYSFIMGDLQSPISFSLELQPSRQYSFIMGDLQSSISFHYVSFYYYLYMTFRSQ